MNSDNDLNGVPGGMTEKYIEEAVLFVVNWHAATVNMRLYPPTSSMVIDTVGKARGHLEELFEKNDVFSVSVLENSLLVNDVRLEEIEQQKAPVKSFVQWMNERGLSNIDFKSGITQEEINTLFEVLAAASDKDHRTNIAEVLIEKGVTNASINQRVYVAVTAGEDFSDGVRQASPLDALKDELLMRYLMGRVDLQDVEDRDLVDVLSDQGKVGGLLSSFIIEEGSEGGVLVRSEKAEEALNRLTDMVDQVEDESLRSVLSEQIGGVISEMTPREMTSMLTGEGPESLNIRHVRERVLTMLSDKKLLEMVDSLIDEYLQMRSESDHLETEWQKQRLRNLNELLVEVREERGDEISELVDERLEGAGIQEERDPTTGRRILSAYQLLGGPLEEEFVALGEGIDQTVTMQIASLYAMEENSLAAGLLAKLMDNLQQESPLVRRFAASLAKETVEQLASEYRLMAADVIQPELIKNIRAEGDYASYVPQVDSLAVLARTYFQEGVPERVSGIIDLLKEESNPEQDKGPELIKHAAAVLEELMSPVEMVDVEALLLETDDEKRINTVRGLASLGPSALSSLIDMLKDRGRAELRDRALEALEAADEVGVEALLVELRKDNPWYVYRNLLNVISDLKLVSAVEQVGAMVEHPDERIRREAVRCLARIGSPESVQMVLNAVNDPSPAVRRTAVRVLGMFGEASVAQFLLDIIDGQGPRGKEEDQAVVEAACIALGDFHDSAHVAPLLEVLNKGGLFKKARPDEIRAAACIALGSIGDASVVPLLQKATRDQSMMVRTSADKALRRMTGAITAPEPVTLEEAEEMGVTGVAALEAPGAAPPAPPPEGEITAGPRVSPEQAAVLGAAPGEPPAEETVEQQVDEVVLGEPADMGAVVEVQPGAPETQTEAEEMVDRTDVGDKPSAPRIPSPPEWVEMPLPPGRPETAPPSETGELPEPGAEGHADEYEPPPITPGGGHIDGAGTGVQPEPQVDEKTDSAAPRVPAAPENGIAGPGQAVELPAEWRVPGASAQTSPPEADEPAPGVESVPDRPEPEAPGLEGPAQDWPSGESQGPDEPPSPPQPPQEPPPGEPPPASGWK